MSKEEATARAVAMIEPPSTEGAWIHCGNDRCRKLLFSKEFERMFKVCKYCGHHARLTATERIEFTVDEGTFKQMLTELRSTDALQFPGYEAKLAKGGDAFLVGTGKLEERPILLGIMDFSFMGGSMGSVVGEKVYRAMEYAAEHKTPIVVFCASGGARMQEGLLALMQMAKTSAGVEVVNEARVPYISVFTNPTMAGVLASFAALGDVILAEPGAKVGFAGERVAAQATVGKPPPDFQTAEFQYHHGMIDRIVPRKEMRRTLGSLLSLLAGDE